MKPPERPIAVIQRKPTQPNDAAAARAAATAAAATARIVKGRLNVPRNAEYEMLHRKRHRVKKKVCRAKSLHCRGLVARTRWLVMRRAMGREGSKGTGAPSYLPFDIHLAKGRLLGILKRVASFACKNSDGAILLLQQRIATKSGDEVEAFALNVLVEELRFATRECKLLGEKLAAYVWFVSPMLSVMPHTKYN